MHLTNGSDSCFIKTKARPTSDPNITDFTVGAHVHKHVDGPFSFSASSGLRVFRPQARIGTRQPNSTSFSSLIVFRSLLDQRFGTRRNGLFKACSFSVLCLTNGKTDTLERFGFRDFRPQPIFCFISLVALQAWPIPEQQFASRRVNQKHRTV